MEQTEQPSNDVENDFEDKLNELIIQLENMSKDARLIGNVIKNLKKEHLKIVKKLTGSRRKKVARDPNAPKKAPSGFAKPTKISEKLANFLGVSDGDLIARPDVTKGITAYVKKHNLQKEENKRIIDLTKPGGKELVELLNVPDGSELTFFNLQKYLKIHFPTSATKVPRVKKEVKIKETKEGEVKTRTRKTVAVATEEPVAVDVAVAVATEDPKPRRRKVDKTT